jgi:hypothetical protein
VAGDRFRVRPNWIIWFAVALHTTWGCLLLASSEPYGATALHAFGGIPRLAMAVVLFLASGLAAWGVTRHPPSLRSLVALLPQQALLTISAYAAVVAVIEAHYPDGVIRPRMFILADQAPAIIVLILHTAAVLEMHARPSAAEVLQARFRSMDTETQRLQQLLTEKASALRRLGGKPPRLAGGGRSAGRAGDEQPGVVCSAGVDHVRAAVDQVVVEGLDQRPRLAVDVPALHHQSQRLACREARPRRQDLDIKRNGISPAGLAFPLVGQHGLPGGRPLLG